MISEVDRYGNKIKTNVIAAGNTIAVQENHITYQVVLFNHWDASGSSYRTSDRIGASYTPAGSDTSPGELDPMGGNVGLETPYIEQPIEPPPPEDGFNEPFLLDQGDTMMVNGQRRSCNLDGMSVSCSSISRESSVQCPNNDCSPRLVTYGGVRQFAFFHAYADGYAGFVPQNAMYNSKGGINPVKREFPTLGRKTQYDKDTDLAKLNDASGHSESVLKFIGRDAAWNSEYFGVITSMLTVKNLKLPTRTRVPDEKLNAIEKLMEKMLGTERCANFLKSLGIDPNDIITAYQIGKSQGGVGYDSAITDSSILAEVTGDTKSIGGAGIGLNNNQKESNPRTLVMVLIHESIHFYGPNDNEMSKLLSDKGYYANGKSKYIDPTGIKNQQAVMGMNSQMWTFVFRDYCTPTEVEIKEWSK